MADNIELNAGSGGSTLATDEISSEHYQKILIGYGADGAWTRVTAAAGFPIQLQTGHADVKVTLDGETITLGAGSAAIGKLAANSGIDIGDVDITSVVPGAGATNLGKAEDAAHASGDVGVMALTVRQDVAAALAGTDADYQPLITDASGRLHVAVGNTVAVSGTFWQATQPVSGTFWQATQPVSGTFWQTTQPVSLASLPGTAAEAAALPSVFVVIAADDGTDTQPLQLNAAGDLKVTLDSESVAVTGTFWQATQPVSGTVTVGSITAGDNNIGNVDIVSLPAGNLGQQAMAASVSIVPASNIADATYIGDIKFGEALPGGSNVIGAVTQSGTWNVATVTTVSAVTAISNALPSGTNTIGGVIAQPSTSAAYDGTTSCIVKEFMVVGTTAGNNVLVVAVADKKIRLLHLEIVALSAVANTVYLVNGDYNLVASATNRIPVAVDADGDSIPGLVTGAGWRRTADTVNEAVVAVQSATAAILYMGSYIEVD